MGVADTALRKEGERVETHLPQKQSTRVLLLTLLFALLLFPSIRRPGLAGYDDSYWAHEGKEMVRTGDWWSVRFDGNFTLEHPPLFPWLEAASFKVFGIHDWAAKFPSAVFGLATILLTYFLALELTGDSWLALMAMLVLGSTQFFLKNATHAMTDVTFTFFCTLALYFYVKGLKNPVYLALLGFPLGAAVLTRSVVGFFVLGIILLHPLLTKKYGLLLSPWLVLGVMLAVAIPGAWYFSQYRLHGGDFVRSHLQFVNGLIQANHGPKARVQGSNYVVALLKYYWPWLPFLLWGMFLQGRAAVRQEDGRARLLFIWVLAVILPFSLAQTKFPRYMIPLLPAFSIFSAMALNQWLPVARRKMFFYAACGIGCVAICLSLLIPPKGRAEDIVKLAPIVDANSAPGQRILIYTYEDGRTDYQYQFLWYGSRYTRVLENLDDLVAWLHAGAATVIIDKQSYQKILPALSGRSPRIVGESENLICFTVS